MKERFPSVYPLKVADFRALAVKIKQALEGKFEIIVSDERWDDRVTASEKDLLDAIVKGINDFYE